MKIKEEIQTAIDDVDTDYLEKFGGTSNGFWYDLTSGGYFKPEMVLLNEDDIKKVKEAIVTLRELEKIYDAVTPEY